MKKIIATLSAAIILISVNSFAEEKKASLNLTKVSNTHEDETLADIRKTLGIVPEFLRDYPAACRAGAWSEFKSIQLNPKSAIPGKYKELVGLAIASQVPCTYCVTFHTEASKFNGATLQEQQEAVAIAAVERHWSTYLNGSQTDLLEFKALADDFVTRMKEVDEGKLKVNVSLNQNAANADEAYSEMTSLFGQVPSFMKKFPKEGVTGAWNNLKTLTFNPDTAIPAKYKDLISLAVSAQIPCQHCIYFDTKAAELDGATSEEISEVLALSSIVRQWSAVLNGNQIDPNSFKKELTQIFSYLKKQSAKS